MSFKNKKKLSEEICQRLLSLFICTDCGVLPEHAAQGAAGAPLQDQVVQEGLRGAHLGGLVGHPP